ncbi:MAG TPA: maleylacetate reductase [Mycobacterium sp.]|jgi:maleylacetate reductase|nr:maleylacetate reductase [Mycobacterium sp.]
MKDTSTNGTSRSSIATRRPGPDWMPADFSRDTLPGRIVFGPGTVEGIADELERLGVQRAMLIAAHYDSHLDFQATRVLGSRLQLRWNEVRQHVPNDLAHRATAAAIDNSADGLVTIGGGSTIGLGKAVAVNTDLPLLTVPTTYSGSEMTPIYGLTVDHHKSTARDDRALPKVVIYDPELLTSLPPAVVGPSGMNALAHCAEALWAPRTDPITDAIALDGAHRIGAHLRTAFTHDDAAGRGQMLIASCLAGVALGTVGTSLHHSLCHLLGGMFDSPHAETHAVMLPYVVQYLKSAVPLAVDRLSVAMNTTPDRLTDTIWSLGRSVGTPHGLRALGLTETQVLQAADAAWANGFASPRSLNRSGLHRLLLGAFRGFAPSVSL